MIFQAGMLCISAFFYSIGVRGRDTLAFRQCQNLKLRFKFAIALNLHYFG